MVVLTREQLEERLAALHQASLELVRNLSLETVLQRIVQLAREQAGARFAALGVVDDDGNLIQFIPVGMTPEEVRRTGHNPAAALYNAYPPCNFYYARLSKGTSETGGR